jgi:hypothetical protein
MLTGLQTQAMDAPKANSKSKAPLAVRVDACSEHVVWETYQKDAPAPGSRIELTSGIESVEPAPKRRWHFRLSVSVTASSKAVRSLRLSRSSIRHISMLRAPWDGGDRKSTCDWYKMGQLGRCLALDRD